MTQYTQIFLQVLFTALIVGCVGALVFALFCELFGWYDSKGSYTGPFSKPRSK